jgi:soluble lytic murein transglycosylase-like protein
MLRDLLKMSHSADNVPGFSPSMRRFAHSIAITVLAVLWAIPAHAQIYSWRDATDRLVLSRTPRPGATLIPSYPVAKSRSVRATRAVDPQRSWLYDGLIAEQAKLNGLRVDLVRAVVQIESAFNPYARSPKGALGLMQLMPGTMREFGVTNAFNPVENVRAGTAYLRQLLNRYQNNEELALAAYNAGPDAVDKHGQSVPPYRETQDYVSEIKHMAPPVVQRGSQIFKVTDIIDGRPVVRYTDRPPTSGSSFEIVGGR